MSDKQVPTTQGSNGSIQCGIWGALAIGLGGAFLVRMGYDLGLNQSRVALRRNDKQLKRMEKRERMIHKEYRKREKEKETGGNRWLWFRRKT